jgi:hypothetical protein
MQKSQLKHCTTMALGDTNLLLLETRRKIISAPDRAFAMGEHGLAPRAPTSLAGETRSCGGIEVARNSYERRRGDIREAAGVLGRRRGLDINKERGALGIPGR